MLQYDQQNKSQIKLPSHPKKFAPSLALKWYLQDLIGRAEVIDISVTNQNRGGKCTFIPRIARLAHKKASFTKGILSLGHAY